MVSEADTPLVKLPVRLADAIDQAVRAFVEANRGLKAHCRWHDADLWMVYQEGTTEVNGNPFILQKRVTVAAFAGVSSFEPDIVFTPDILVIAPEGRYILPADKRTQGQDTFTIERPQDLDSLADQVASKLRTSWDTALSLAKQPQAANVFLHSGGYRQREEEDQG